MRSLKACWAILRMQLVSKVQYRAAAWASMTTNAFWGAVHVIIILTFYKYGLHSGAGTVSGMSMAQAVSYVWLVQVLLSLLSGSVIDAEIREKIRNGDVGIELCRPLDLYFHWFARSIAVRLGPFLLNVVPITVLAMVLPEPYRLQPPASLSALIASTGAVVMGLLLCCACTGLTHVLLMRVQWGEGPTNIFISVIDILSGAYLPLQLWPGWAQRFLQLQPFAGIIDLPLRLYVGTLEPGAIWQVLLMQSGWLVVMIAGGWMAMRRVLTHMVIQGG